MSQLFWSKVKKKSEQGCWNWTACRHIHHGYGLFRHHYKLYRAHRFSYELCKGPIPAGLTLDHLCGNRACVNPAHLEPVPIRVNATRSPGKLKHCTHRTERDVPCNDCIAQHLKNPPAKNPPYLRKTVGPRPPAVARKLYAQTGFAEKHRAPWTKEEDELVLRHSMTDLSLSKLIKRSVKAIWHRRGKLRGALKEVA